MRYKSFKKAYEQAIRKAGDTANTVGDLKTDWS